jgi:hypothetical protein
MVSMQDKVKPWWVKYESDPDSNSSPDCVRCGCCMSLSLDCEWHEDPNYNFCHDCAHELVEECMEKLNGR